MEIDPDPPASPNTATTRTRRQSAAALAAQQAANEPRHSRRLSERGLDPPFPTPVSTPHSHPPPPPPVGPPPAGPPKAVPKETPLASPVVAMSPKATGPGGGTDGYGTRRAVAASMPPAPLVAPSPPAASWPLKRKKPPPTTPAPTTTSSTPATVSAASTLSNPAPAPVSHPAPTGKPRHANQWTKRRDQEANGLDPGPRPKHPNQWTKLRERQERERLEAEAIAAGLPIPEPNPPPAGAPSSTAHPTRSTSASQQPASTMPTTAGTGRARNEQEKDVNEMVALVSMDLGGSSSTAGASPSDTSLTTTTVTGPASPVASFNNPPPVVAPANSSDAHPVHGTRSSTGSLKKRRDSNAPAPFPVASGSSSAAGGDHVDPLVSFRSCWPPKWVRFEGDDEPEEGEEVVGKVTLKEADRDDANLMVICAALASVDNRALCPKELVSLIEAKGWAKFRGAQKFNIVYTAIKTHLRRASIHSYPPLLDCFTLVGVPSPEEERCMGVDRMGKPQIRRGSLWFLSREGAGFDNPFEGVAEKGVKRKRAGHHGTLGGAGFGMSRSGSLATESRDGEEADEDDGVIVVAAARGQGKGKGPKRPRAPTVTTEDEDRASSHGPQAKVGMRLKLKLRPSTTTTTGPKRMDVEEREDDATGSEASSASSDSDDSDDSDEEGNGEGHGEGDERGRVPRKRRRPTMTSDGRPPRLAAQQRLAMRSYHRSHALDFSSTVSSAPPTTTAISHPASVTATAGVEGLGGQRAKEGVMSPQFMFRPGFAPPGGASRFGGIDLGSTRTFTTSAPPTASSTLAPVHPPAATSSLQPPFDYFPRQLDVAPTSPALAGAWEDEDEEEEEEEEEEGGDYAEAMLRREEYDTEGGGGGSSPAKVVLLRSARGQGRKRRRSSMFEDVAVDDDEDDEEDGDGEEGGEDGDEDTPATTPRSAAAEEGGEATATGSGTATAAGGEGQVDEEEERVIGKRNMDVTLCPRVAAAKKLAEAAEPKPSEQATTTTTTAASVSVSLVARTAINGPRAKPSLKNLLSIATTTAEGFPTSAPTTPLPLPPMLSLADKMGYTSLCETRAPSMALDVEQEDEEEGEGAVVGSGEEDEDQDEDDEVMMVGETSSACITPDRQSSIDSFDVGTVTGVAPTRRDWDEDTVMADADTTAEEGQQGGRAGGAQGQADGPETLDLEELDQVWEAESPVVTFVKLEDDHHPVVAITHRAPGRAGQEEKEFLTCSAAPYGPSPPPAAVDSPATNAGLGISGASTPEEQDEEEGRRGQGQMEAEMLDADVIVETEVLNTPTADSPEETPPQQAPPSSSPSSSGGAVTGPCKKARDALGRVCLDFDELAARMTVGKLLTPNGPVSHPTVAVGFGKTLVYAMVVEHSQSRRKLAILRGVDTDEIYIPTLLELLDWSKDKTTNDQLAALAAEGRNARLVDESGDVPGIWLKLNVARHLVSRRPNEAAKLADFFRDNFPGRWPRELATMSPAWRALSTAASNAQASSSSASTGPAGSGQTSPATATRSAAAAKRAVPMVAVPPMVRKQPAPRPRQPTPPPSKKQKEEPVEEEEEEEEEQEEPAPRGRGRRVSARRAALDAKTASRQEAAATTTAAPNLRSSTRRRR